LNYALGKAHDDRKQYELAMKHYDEANRINFEIVRAGRPYDLKTHRESIDQIIELFTADFIARHRHVGNESELPIFIIGMIRSGTTLTEQMISSHPQVGAAGEQVFWTSDSAKAVNLSSGSLNEALLQQLESTYLQIIRRYAPDMPRITDKMPLNFLWAGLIHIAFPNAPIIHVRRAPIDTCLSIYFTGLTKAPDFAYKKENIVAGYREYQRLMRHWHDVLPSNRFLEFEYEDLVDDQERVLRKIIEFCRLEWSDACLHHEQNERSVSTPSVWQARQPVYKTSVERWRKYEPWLGAFAELLGDEP